MNGAESEAPEFGRTWWGRAWVGALEQRARLDPNRLPRGREYARSGAVGSLTITPGEACAQVQGRKTEPYRVRVRVRQFTDDEWGRVLTAISARLGHAAALLDGELPPEVADDVAGTGLDLLPGGGEVGPRCDCPDDADPCKHSAAACYLVSDALDADPFVLLLLRGRSRDQVLAGVRSRRRGDNWSPDRGPRTGATVAGPDSLVPEGSPAGPSDGPATGRMAEDAGVDARSAFARSTTHAGIPAPPLPPARPGQPVALPVDPPAWRPGLGGDLRELAADAAARAWETAVGLSPDAGLGLDQDCDLARRAERVLGTPLFGLVARRSGTDARDLARQALAWRHGGLPGLELLRASWDPAADEPNATDLLKAAGAVLRAKTGEPGTISGNWVTAGRLQLRLGRDLRWYPYARSGGHWEPSGPPTPGPAEAVSDL